MRLPWPGSAIAQFAALATLAAVGTSLGLLISTLARSEEMAIALVPIAIMPQIILAGVIAPLNGLGKLLARAVITVHWGKQALESLLPEPDLALLGLEQVEYGRELSVVSVHVAALAAATLLTLSLQDKAKGRL